MNILPKKRWHVRTKQNIERVRRDEAKAAEEEKELERRIKLAEQEARTDLLRKRAGQSVKNDKGTKELASSQKLQHVNFFKEIEETGGYVGGTNKEYEIEKKSEKEKYEKNIGLLTYLGQSSVEAMGKAPWYTQPRHAKKRHADSDDSDSDDDDTASKKNKARIDPLNDMKRYLAHKKSSSETSHVSKKNEKTSKKDKPKKDSSKKTLEELRAERLERERIERERTKQLLEKYKNGAKPEEPVILDDRQRRYNSQFNPHLARQSLNLSQHKTSNVRHYGYPKL